MGALLSQDIFLKRCKDKYGEIFDYSKVIYLSAKSKIIIGCNIHGWFNISPWRFIINKKGCPKCGHISSAETKSHKLYSGDSNAWFIEKALKIFGNLYNYDKINYLGSKKKVEIFCKRHGYFWQSPSNHLHGMGCLQCKNLLTTEEFISKASIIHCNLYDYSLVDYINCQTPVIIICKKHGIFQQAPKNHLGGKGCSTCNLSKGELRIKRWLNDKNIKYVEQYKFDDCINEKTGYKLRYDFYIPSKNILIEYDGKQHFVLNKEWTKETEESFSNRQYKDSIKTKYAEDKNIKLIRIKYTDIKKIENILDILLT